MVVLEGDPGMSEANQRARERPDAGQKAHAGVDVLAAIAGV